MSDYSDRMKFDILKTPAEDLLQIALSLYDDTSDNKKVKELMTRKPISTTLLDGKELMPKTIIRENRLNDLHLNEMLGLGLLGQYFSSHDNNQYDAVITVDDSSLRNTEALISDGALMKVGTSSRMIVQQVMAQNIAGNTSENIDEIILNNLQKKNAKMKAKSYPEMSALLINVFSNEKVNLNYILKRGDFTFFPTYFLNVFGMPNLEDAVVTSLGGTKLPVSSQGDSKYFILTRHPNPYMQDNQ